MHKNVYSIKQHITRLRGFALKLFESADDEWLRSESKRVIVMLFLTSLGALWLGYVHGLLLNAFLFDLMLWTLVVALAVRNHVWKSEKVMQRSSVDWTPWFGTQEERNRISSIVAICIFGFGFLYLVSQGDLKDATLALAAAVVMSLAMNYQRKQLKRMEEDR